VLRLKKLMPLLHDIMVINEGAEVGASEGENAFRIHVPLVSEDLQKVWRDFLVNYAEALKAKHSNLTIEITNIQGKDWIEIVVRTI